MTYPLSSLSCGYDSCSGMPVGAENHPGHGKTSSSNVQVMCPVMSSLGSFGVGGETG